MADSKFKTWFKRVGLLGFLFFFIKGLVWLAIFYGLGTGVKGCSDEAESAGPTTTVERNLQE